MAIREYIGARYVPRFMGTYNPSQLYEVLDVVDNGMGTSYILKKPAPVGTPVTDTNYWAIYGASSGAIINLQNQIDVLNTGSWLYHKNVVVYGDSTVVDNALHTSYMKRASDSAKFNLTNRAVPATRINVGSDNAVSLINAALDLGTFDYIFLCYGTNDWQHDRKVGDIKTDITTLINLVRSKSADIGIIFILPYYSFRDFNNGLPTNCNNNGYTLQSFTDEIAHWLNELDVGIINFYHRSTCDENNYRAKLLNDSGGSIFVHPTDAFKEELAQIVLQGIDYEKYYNLIPIINNNDFVLARKGVSVNDLNHAPTIYHGGGVYSGYCLNLAANTTYHSTMKLLENGFYIIRGACSGDVTINIGSDSYPISSATSFNIPVYVNAGYKQITITSASGCIVSDFSIYWCGRYFDQNFKYRFGCLVSCPTTPGLTFPLAPAIEYRRDDILLRSFAVRLESSMQYGNVIFELPADVMPDNQYILGVRPVSGITAMLEIGSDGKVYLRTTITDDGNYLFNMTPIINYSYPNIIY